MSARQEAMALERARARHDQYSPPPGEPIIRSRARVAEVREQAHDRKLRETTQDVEPK